MAKSEQTPENRNPTRLQRILAAMIVGVVGAAIVSIAVLLAAAAFKWSGVFQIFGPLAAAGMLVGLLLMVTLLVVSIRQKAIDNRSNQ